MAIGFGNRDLVLAKMEGDFTGRLTDGGALSGVNEVATVTALDEGERAELLLEFLERFAQDVGVELVFLGVTYGDVVFRGTGKEEIVCGDGELVFAIGRGQVKSRFWGA